MEAVVLCGMQGSGKTTFYVERFLATHVRIGMDLLRTRHREAAFLRTCIETRQRFVADGTNPTAEDRRRYVAPALAAGFRAVAYWLDVPSPVALARNAKREGRERIPVPALLGTRKRLVVPSRKEGFAEVFHVTPTPEGGFEVVPLDAGET